MEVAALGLTLIAEPSPVFVDRFTLIERGQAGSRRFGAVPEQQASPGTRSSATGRPRK